MIYGRHILIIYKDKPGWGDCRVLNGKLTFEEVEA